MYIISWEEYKVIKGMLNLRYWTKGTTTDTKHYMVCVINKKDLLITTDTKHYMVCVIIHKKDLLITTDTQQYMLCVIIHKKDLLITTDTQQQYMLCFIKRMHTNRHTLNIAGYEGVIKLSPPV